MHRPAVALLCLALVAAPLAGEGQPAGKHPRIGILRPGSPPDPLVEAFRQGLRGLGYDEGRNITIEYRWAEGRDERLPRLATDLVRLNLDVIVAAGGGSMEAARQATQVIPIVMPVTVGDPVKLGIVASLARPGGNLTGLTQLAGDLPGKWMELLREMLPQASRMAVLWDAAGDPGQVRASEDAARSLGIRLHVLKVGEVSGLEPAFIDARRNAEALIVSGSPLFYVQRSRLVQLAAKHRLPAIYAQREFVAGSGGLISYGADYQHQFRRAATYVDKILRGARPADLPIEQATKFELVVNLKTAKALGLTIPQSVLLRADDVIRE